MIVVQQGNKQLKINEDAKGVYLSLGYSVIDEEGKIVEAGQATSLAEIKAENATLKSKLAEYKDNSAKLDEFEAIQAQNEALKVANADLTGQLEAATNKK